jgi:hypothetical protein
MVKTIFMEIDELSFNRIKLCDCSYSGMIDEKKLFSKLNVGDSIIFSYKNNRIEGCIKKINIFNSIQEYLQLNTEIKTIEYNGNNQSTFLTVMNDQNKKKVRIYDVDYHPYDNNTNYQNNIKNQSDIISKFLDSLAAKNNKYTDDDDDDDDDDEFI